MKGNENSIKKMKDWLKKTGSPKSRIDRAEFKDTPISNLEFSSFEIRK
jgi:acylphosphatase